MSDRFLDVPRNPSHHQRTVAFKKEHGIFTYGCKSAYWDALLVPAAIKLLAGYGVKPDTHPVDMVANYCRLLEERDLLVTAPTRIAAIRELCARNNIDCPL